MMLAKGLRHKSKGLLVGVLLLLWCLGVYEQADANIRQGNTARLGMRIGDNASVSTVIYNAGIPFALGGLPGVTAAAPTVSTNAITGGSGVFTVFIQTIANRRGTNRGARVRGRYFYDSSTPLSCITPATCGTETINFSEISWNTRDTDTLTGVTRYNNAAGQRFQFFTDTNRNIARRNNVRENWYQYMYDNTQLLPAGTYEGEVALSATGLLN